MGQEPACEHYFRQQQGDGPRTGRGAAVNQMFVGVERLYVHEQDGGKGALCEPQVKTQYIDVSVSKEAQAWQFIHARHVPV